MSGRSLGILALLALLAAGAAWYARRPAPAPAEPQAESGPFLPGLADRLADVGEIRVRVGGGLELAHVIRDGERWRVANRAGYPADAETLRGTLIRLTEARRLAAKTDRPDGWPRLGLAPIGEPGADGVELTLEGLDPALRVLIGRPAAHDADGTYVRRVDGDDTRAWLVSGRIERPDTIADWLDDRLTAIPAGRIQSVRIEARDGDPVRVARPSPRANDLAIANRPEDRRPLSPTIARSLARIVSDLHLTDVAPADAVDLPPRLAVAHFTTFDGLHVRIEAFAAERRQDPRYVRLRAEADDGAGDAVRREARSLNERLSGWVYRIPDYKFFNLTQTLEGVLEKPREGA